MQTQNLTTKALAVPGVEVVANSKGKSITRDPFYPDQLDVMRDTLRAMRRRERFEVAPDGIGFRIYRKPQESSK